MSRPKLPDGARCGRIGENGPSLSLQPSRVVGSCNGCSTHNYLEKVWELRLNSLLVRLCDDCFDSLIAQRKEHKKNGRRA